MAAPKTALSRWSQYIAARLVAMGMTAFNVEDNLDTAAMIGRVMYHVDPRHRQRAAEAIRRSFPQWEDCRVQQVAAASFEHFMQLAVEVLHTPREITADAWIRHASIHNLEPGIDLFNQNRGVLMVTGHMGNWEVLGYIMATLGYDVDAIARPIDNPLINDWLLGIREKQGMRIITKWDATERMLAVLNQGGSLGFIADQNAGDRGMFVPFFGRLASTYKSIGLLAISQETPIVCGYAHRLGPGFSYELGINDVIMPEDWVDQPDPLYYVTARYNLAIEQGIRMRPEQYLWMHRRWKSRPKWEREGKPMPKIMRKKLEQLPWMTEALLHECEQPVVQPRKRKRKK